MTLHRFLTRLIWVCAAPLVLLSLYLAAMHVRALSIQQNREAMDRVRNVATALDNNLGARIAALQVLSGSPFLDEPFRLNEFYRIAQAYQKYFGAHIVVADTSSQALLNTRVPFGTPLAKLPVPKGRSAVALTLATGKPAVGDMFYGPVARQQLVALTAPVIRNGSVKALLLCTIEVQQLKKRLDQEALPDSWSLALFDSSDTYNDSAFTSHCSGCIRYSWCSGTFYDPVSYSTVGSRARCAA